MKGLRLMRIFTIAVVISLFACSISAGAQILTLSFTNDNQWVYPSGSDQILNYEATITNTGSYSINLDSSAISTTITPSWYDSINTITDNFFTNSPTSLESEMSWTGDLMDITIPSAAQAGDTLGGTYAINYDYTDSSGNTINANTQDTQFTASVLPPTNVPEPNDVIFLLAGGASLLGMLRKRRL